MIIYLSRSLRFEIACALRLRSLSLAWCACFVSCLFGISDISNLKTILPGFCSLAIFPFCTLIEFHRFLIEILEKWNGRGKKPKMDDHHSSCLRLACVDLSRRHQEPTKLSQRFTLPIIFQITTDPLINTMAADGETINLVSTSIII